VKRAVHRSAQRSLPNAVVLALRQLCDVAIPAMSASGKVHSILNAGMLPMQMKVVRGGVVRLCIVSCSCVKQEVACMSQSRCRDYHRPQCIIKLRLRVKISQKPMYTLEVIRKVFCNFAGIRRLWARQALVREVELITDGRSITRLCNPS
jgi:hypothetical protein